MNTTADPTSIFYLAQQIWGIIVLVAGAAAVLAVLCVAVGLVGLPFVALSELLQTKPQVLSGWVYCTECGTRFHAGEELYKLHITHCKNKGETHGNK